SADRIVRCRDDGGRRAQLRVGVSTDGATIATSSSRRLTLTAPEAAQLRAALRDALLTRAPLVSWSRPRPAAPARLAPQRYPRRTTSHTHSARGVPLARLFPPQTKNRSIAMASTMYRDGPTSTPTAPAAELDLAAGVEFYRRLGWPSSLDPRRRRLVLHTGDALDALILPAHLASPVATEVSTSLVNGRV